MPRNWRNLTAEELVQTTMEKQHEVYARILAGPIWERPMLWALVRQLVKQGAEITNLAKETVARDEMDIQARQAQMDARLAQLAQEAMFAIADAGKEDGDGDGQLPLAEEMV